MSVKVRDGIFVGGTGRSGTTIVARLLAADPTNVMIPVETRFLVDPHGLTDVIAGTASFERFETKLRKQWWPRYENRCAGRGVPTFIDYESLEAGLEELRKRVGTAPVAAASDFVRRWFDPIAQATGAERWIEMTPPNVARGADLVAMMGGGTRIIHVMRDGRDVAASVVDKNWGPNQPNEALEWWAQRMAQAHAGCAGLADSNLLVVQLEDLVVRDREATVDSVAAFGGLGTTHLWNFLNRHMRADRAHIGRWTDVIEQNNRTRFNERYDELRDVLVAQGCPVPV